MNKEILYLSYFPQEDGFLFPDELPDHYFSPGLFIAEEDGSETLPYAYRFDAMDAGRRVQLNLVRFPEADENSNLYVVHTDFYGDFWFSLDKMNPALRYRGRRPMLRGHQKFRIAVTRDSQKLERVCKEFDFYFIGSTMTEEEQY
ncbi:hypothetical protein [Ruegeria lacuscaerulensis]|uniref:hypothetical protein n=1 Tax=Ruegeria lacuscaerulensis TaxID=55218 RepID=UPI00147D5680|nr:hypothetical protein [Ruegeria lacuscaerulensis]